ncbi:hypothetical protein, partial [Bacillus badius]|uniref:hypothetical protein n=1 Tax=Bacillus badius TaxID=1455 RepID=UPI002E1D2575|nr:hypothetical protein [Bacillus badius]
EKCSLHYVDPDNESEFRDLIYFLILFKIHYGVLLGYKLGVISSRFDTPHHTKRALFVQVPENPSNRNAPFSKFNESQLQ